MPRSVSPDSVESRVAQQVHRSARGTVFTPDSFATLGSRSAIDKALQRMAARGELRRLSRGLYDKPRKDEMLGTLWPSVDAIVKAVAGKDRIRTQPAYWQAVRAGLGIGFVATYLLREDSAVLPVLPQLKLPTLPMWLVVHREIRTSARIRAVYDFLAQAVPSAL